MQTKAFKIVTRPTVNAPDWTSTRLLAGHLLLFDKKGRPRWIDHLTGSTTTLWLFNIWKMVHLQVIFPLNLHLQWDFP